MTRITLELVAGSEGHRPVKGDMQINIDALQRAIDGKPLSTDFVLLIDTKSILEGIKESLPSQ